MEEIQKYILIILIYVVLRTSYRFIYVQDNYSTWYRYERTSYLNLRSLW